MSPPDPAAVHAALLAWYARQGRSLPWRETRDAYSILVSELMLQQTQVSRVLPKWREFLDRFPTLGDLARTSRADVLRTWSGLGYNLRAVRLHEIARQASERDGRLPGSFEGLLGLNGLGRYTAAAVACFAYGEPLAVLDTNIRRVLCRVFLGRTDSKSTATPALWRLAEDVLPAARAFEWNQALMDLGATICTSRRPLCPECPLADLCEARAHYGDWLAGQPRLVRERPAPYGMRSVPPRRILRGRLVKLLTRLQDGSWLALRDAAPTVLAEGQAGEELAALAAGLARDGLIELQPALNCDPLSARARLPGEQIASGADAHAAPGAVKPA